MKKLRIKKQENKKISKDSQRIFHFMTGNFSLFKSPVARPQGIRRFENKRGISMPFEWIFAMLIGGIIIFIAIYAAIKGLDSGNRIANTQVISRLESYLSPYETGLGSGTTGEMHFSSTSTIYFDKCEENKNPPFGMQTISFTQEMFDENQEKSQEIPLVSKYVFANKSVTGKDFYIASVPFFMGYKVSDLIIIYSNKYCFVNAPNPLIDEVVEKLQLKNIEFTDDITNCTGIKTCFDFDNNKCQIVVNQNSVEKIDKKGRRTNVYYYGNLMYAAIFSSDDLYECNIKRLMSKFNELGKVYLEKINVIQLTGCNSNVGIKLNSAMRNAENIENSQGLLVLSEEIDGNDGIKSINDATQEGCKLFSGE